MIFCLLGFPMGALLRHSSQLAAFACAMGYGFVYYLLFLRLGKELVGFEAVPPAVAAWTTNGLFTALGAFLFRRAFWP